MMMMDTIAHTPVMMAMWRQRRTERNRHNDQIVVKCQCGELLQPTKKNSPPRRWLPRSARLCCFCAVVVGGMMMMSQTNAQHKEQENVGGCGCGGGFVLYDEQSSRDSDSRRLWWCDWGCHRGGLWLEFGVVVTMMTTMLMGVWEPQLLVVQLWLSKRCRSCSRHNVVWWCSVCVVWWWFHTRGVELTRCRGALKTAPTRRVVPLWGIVERRRKCCWWEERGLLPLLMEWGGGLLE